MGVTIVPKDFYHDCFSKEDTHQNEAHHDESHFKAKCAICDFTFINTYLSADKPATVTQFTFSSVLEHFAIAENTSSSETLFLNKSPPALSFVS